MLADREGEKPAWVLCTTQRLYVLSQGGGEQESYDLSVVSHYLWSSFERMTLGLFLSWMRLDAPNNMQSVVLQGVSHLMFHRLLDLIRLYVPKLPLKHVAKTTVAALKHSLIGANCELLLYCRVRLRRKTRRTVIFNVTSETVWKSFLLSEDAIILCDEDIGRWFTNMGHNPTFTDVQKHRISDVAGILHDV